MIDIKNYKILFSNNKIKVVYIWMIVTIFIIISIIIIIKNINYVDFYQNDGIGTKEGYIKTIVNVNDIEKLVNHNELVIDNQHYKYQILKVSEQINQVESKFYQEIFISLNQKTLPNRYISFKIPIKKYNLFDYIKNKIRGNI